MRWLMITRKLDPADDRLGFVIRWVEELAARLDHLDVICQELHTSDLPGNVSAYSMGKETGVGRLEQARRLNHTIRTLTPQVDGVFCHMIPRYTLFAAPWTKRYHKPLFLWFTHRQTSLELSLANRLATHILTASPNSYPLKTDKLHVMGHGIETNLFAPASGENKPLEVILVARLAHIKRQDWLLRAASRVMLHDEIEPFRVMIVGGPVEKEPNYPDELAALVSRLHPKPDVTFTGPLPHDEVAAIMQRCAIAVNLSPSGLFDKAALEPMIVGKPTLVTNEDFLPLLGESADLLFLPENAGDGELADRLVRLLALSPQERAALGNQLRERAVMAHSLDGLMDRIAALMREVTSRG
jgi:glycosyltransferase involved in cell wall biosynthesis